MKTQRQRFQGLGDRLRCADIKVPIDWNDPNRGALSMSLVRIAAADPAKRQGALFFNPGGPGNDGLNVAVRSAYVWSQANRSSEYGEQLYQMQAQYDLIGFSPRGTGNSTRIICGFNKGLSAALTKWSSLSRPRRATAAKPIST